MSLDSEIVKGLDKLALKLQTITKKNKLNKIKK